MKKSKIILDKPWKEIVFSAAGFGPNLLMVLMMAYFTNALIPTGLSEDIGFWSYGGNIIVSTIIFPILWTIGRIFDGVVDVPLAALTDSFGNNNKKRKLAILICFLPMLVSFGLCWWPVFGMGANLSQLAKVGNTIWIFVLSIIFFASYTLGLIIFYGSLSEICTNQTQRARVSSYKSVFDTINYALVYAAIPVIFKSINIPIWKVAIYLSPLMLTILIPIFFFKDEAVEEVKTNKKVKAEENVSFLKSLELTFSSGPFLKWTIVNCIAFFGLQMFLVSQNTLISGVMNLGAKWAALLNTMAFAPVPLMLYFFNKVRRRKGIRFAYQSCLICFAIGILTFAIGGTYFWGDNIAPKLIIGSIGGVIGSWGISGFFMTPYLIPSQIAAVEKEVIHKSHSAMYYAIQALLTSAVGAISSSLIYNYLKLWTKPVSPTFEWKCGVSLVPFIVLSFCICGFFLCYLMPRRYTPKIVAEDLKKRAINKIKKYKKSLIGLEISSKRYIKKINKSDRTSEVKKLLIEREESSKQLRIISINNKIKAKEDELKLIETYKKESDEESVINFEKEGALEQFLLFILSGTIFGIFDLFNALKKCKKININFSTKEKTLIYLSLLIPFVSIYSNYIIEKKLEDKLNSLKITFKSGIKLVCISSIILPLFTNYFAMKYRLEILNKLADTKTNI